MAGSLQGAGTKTNTGTASGQMPCFYTFSKGKRIHRHLLTLQISAYINLVQQTDSGSSLAEPCSVQGFGRPRREGVFLHCSELPGRVGLKLCPLPCAMLVHPWDCFEVGSSCLHPPGLVPQPRNNPKSGPVLVSCRSASQEQHRRIPTQIPEKLKGKNKTLWALLGGGKG